MAAEYTVVYFEEDYCVHTKVFRSLEKANNFMDDCEWKCLLFAGKPLRAEY